MAIGTAAIVGIAGAGISAYSASKQRKAARGAENRARADMAEQNRLLDIQKQKYRDIEFTNPYADMQNQFADYENQFAGLQTKFENVYEDLTVNQQQAQFEAQQGAQQRANIMQSLRGAAGGSGIAGLAQAMANQGQLATQRASASIGQQEARNQALAAQGAASVQQAEAQREMLIAQGAGQADLQRRQGAMSVDMQRRAGEEMVQQAEMSRQATLLGMQQGQTAGAPSAAMQAGMKTQAAITSGNQMMTSAVTGLAGLDKNVWKDPTP